MPLIREYRVVMPLTVEEFERGRRWHKVEQIKLEQKLLQNDNIQVAEFGERTILREKIPHIPNFFSEAPIKQEMEVEHHIRGYGSASRCSIPVPIPFFASVGSFIDVLLANTISLTEVESWEAYPYFRSVSSNSSLGSNYKMIIEGVCLPGNATEENPLHLPERLLKERKVILVDIASNVASQDYRDGKDPVLFRSEKTGRGPLEPGVWMEDDTLPRMTCYILVSIHFNFLGPLGYIAESYLHGGIARAMRLHHRELFCYIDEWIDFPLEALKKLEQELQQELETGVNLKLGITSGALQIEEPQVNDKPDPKDISFVEEVPAAGKRKSGGLCGCPIEAIKSAFAALFSSKCCGGSLGYSFVMCGVLACFLALCISVLSFFGIFY